IGGNLGRVPPLPRPPPIASSITTRSMSQIGTLGSQLTPARNVGFVNPAYDHPHTPVQQQNLGGRISNMRPPTPLSNLGLGRQVEIELMELRQRLPVANPAAQVGLSLADANLSYHARHPITPVRQAAPPPPG